MDYHIPESGFLVNLRHALLVSKISMSRMSYRNKLACQTETRGERKRKVLMKVGEGIQNCIIVFTSHKSI